VENAELVALGVAQHREVVRHTDILRSGRAQTECFPNGCVRIIGCQIQMPTVLRRLDVGHSREIDTQSGHAKSDDIKLWVVDRGANQEGLPELGEASRVMTIDDKRRRNNSLTAHVRTLATNTQPWRPVVAQYRRRVAIPSARYETPLLSRYAAIGAGAAGLVAGVIGLLVGLLVYPPTAWFAVFELGVPASVLGALVGFTWGLMVYATRMRKRRSR
jgi:hypothetical protein